MSNRRWQHVWRLLPLLVVLTLLLTGCGDPYLSALTPSGPVADQQLSLMKISIGVMIFVFVVVMIIFTYVLVRYRKRPGQEGIPKQVEGSHTLEIIWTTIPIILLIVIAIPTVSTTFALAKDHWNDPDAIKVKVTGHQFWWEFEYPDLGVTTAQDLHIPVGKKIALQIGSKDVIHSFWVPALAGKIDANPGNINSMWMQADKVGVFKGKCAELCGYSHALMDFKVIAEDPADFDKWIAGMKAAETAKPTASTQLGQQVYEANCLACHAIGGQGGKVGPNLTDFGDRQTIAGYLDHNADELKRWISNPDEVKTGAKVKMPAFGDKLKPEEMDALVDYLMGLKINQ
ncbi:cytochrome c oxidase subunit II [Brevibacillus sp. B_LB10_24]|uniref:cytochrome c oxidase subunit II n=1 Tax=Brevibacillus sp. B_LB10_24 TaxID=3380645 RepID=UPI0038BCB3A4